MSDRDRDILEGAARMGKHPLAIQRAAAELDILASRSGGDRYKRMADDLRHAEDELVRLYVEHAERKEPVDV